VDVINSWQLFQHFPNVPEITDDAEPFLTVGQDAVAGTLAKLQFTPAAVSLLIDPAYETAFSYVYRKDLSLWDRPPDAPFVQAACIYIRDPDVNLKTSAYRDMDIHVRKIMMDLVVHDSYPFVLLLGDEQYISRVWHLKLADPLTYHHLIPYPSEFHLCIHWTHALYRLGGESWMLPIAEHLAFKNISIDFVSKYWDKQEDFLLIFTQGVLEWLWAILEETKDGLGWSASRIISKLTANRQV
jgi:hypothetical protein